WDDPSFQPYRAAFPEEHRTSPEALQAHVEHLTKRDIKVAYLKNLQGYLWQAGYRTGAYSTTLFEDVVPQLRQWKVQGLSLAIYSSGSIFAQKLLFGHPPGTEDLTALFDGWFDTTNAGMKTESASYAKIARDLEWKPEQILFLSDNVKEIDAAHEAKMQAVLVHRPGNAEIAFADRSRLQLVESLTEIYFNKGTGTEVGKE
ncbi:hypothetical protein CERZMDRAFT_40299, partial [Cercospora zeae-maydis SCOH1-5]